MKRLFLSAGLMLAAMPAHAQTAPEISVDTMKEITKTLSSDAFEGRAPGTPGEEKTLAYLAERFAQAGLKPGNNGSWFQDVPLVSLTAQNVTPLTFTGAGAPIALRYGTDMVIASYRVTPKIAVKDSDVVFVGYGINAPEKGWNDYAGVDVKGKTVVILVNDPDYESTTLDGPFGGKAMTYYGRWTYKFEEAARQGAAAAIIVHDTVPAAYGWNVVESSWTGPQQVADAANGHMDQSAAVGWIQLDFAKRLFAGAGQDFDRLSAAAKVKGFKAVPFRGVKMSVAFDNEVRKHASKNVIGILPGTTAPNEYLLYSAHWDHLGRCTPAPDGDDICNGAIDNASGTAALVALAEANVKAGPTARSQLFLAVTAEESGLLGSAYYADHPVYPLAQTVAGINMDSMSMAGLTKNVTVTGAGKSELDGYLAKALVAQGRGADPDPRPQGGGYYRSDHFSFAKRGVPMLNAHSGGALADPAAEARRVEAQKTRVSTYHGPKDEYDPNWDWSAAVQDLSLYFDIGRVLGNGTDWPNWVPGDEFRAIRDKSRAGK
ncbi:M28 family metallopeptidase [Sphingomonas sp.]|uniref:M28 family metallopeptidase n=1 Tax=Sphingomonas sp. TaxID=28214 RepID=UPI002B8CC31F|nr:M28 family metallopeptidase [Sphingomonas sp.]HWK35501.1 M28 family metallopeptidase [Sphingomonas sp.]